jgi:hypothetical protein
VTDFDLNLYNNRVNKDGRFFGAPQCEGHGARKDWERREIYSIHTPGLPILIAPAYALALRFGLSPRATVCLFMNLLAALLAVNVWLFCLWGLPPALYCGRSGREAPLWPPLLCTAAVMLTPPVVFYANLVYPELPAALFVLYAFRRALPAMIPGNGEAEIRGLPHSPDPRIRASLLLPSLAVAFLPWLSFRFFLPAFVLSVMLVLRAARERAKPMILALAPSLPLLVSLALLFSYQHRAFGSLNPAAGYLYQNYGERGLSSRGVLDGIFGILLDRGHGILTWSPVYLLSLTGLILIFRERRMAGIWMAALLLAVYLPGAHFIFWWGGFAPPPRYMVVPAPLLGGALCYALAGRPRRSFVALFLLLLSLSMLAGYLGCAHPGLLYRHRHLVTRYLPRFPLRVFPSFFRKDALSWPLAAFWSAVIVSLSVFLSIPRNRTKAAAR